LTISTFLARTRPKFAVISVGKYSYGRPAPSTIARLKAHHVRTYSTQRNGSVTVTVTKGGKATWYFSRGSKLLGTGG
jgi:competence protein ComEC